MIDVKSISTHCTRTEFVGTTVLDTIGLVISGIDDTLLKEIKVDIDESMDLAQKYRIMSVPNMIIFKDGAPVDAVIGAVPANHLKEKLDAVL